MDERQKTKPYSSTGGLACVHSIYGTSYMLSVTGEEQGVGAGVPLRASEPLEGINSMKRLRKTEKVTDLARGPGRLAAALAIDRWLDGVETCVPTVRFGLGLRFERLRRLAQLYASASRMTLTGCCVSLRRAAPS